MSSYEQRTPSQEAPPEEAPPGELFTICFIPRGLDIRLLQRDSALLLGPNLLVLALVSRREEAIDLPQPPIRFINVELIIVSFVGNMRFKNLIQPVRCFLVGLVFIGKVHSDVLNCESNKRLVLAYLPATHPHSVSWHLDKVDDNVEIGQAIDLVSSFIRLR